MKKTLLIAVGLTTTFLSTAQIVTIPDTNFKAYLVGNTSINTNSDTEIQVSEAAAFTGDIFASNLSITDLTGIEAFTSITGLYCGNNNLGSIDISSNTALTFLDCQNASLTALDLSTNTALAGINCFFNSLTSLNLSNNTALTSVNCSNNDLTSLNVSSNILLSNFSCDNNDLTSLDVSNNTALLYFVCHFNELTSIDVSNCTALGHFSCAGNELTSIDVSNNTSLGNFYCAVNNITHLDVSANTSMILLRCDDNDLSSLNVANGNNVNFNMFNASVNPNLTCIQVDDEVWSTANWTSIDATASFSEDCNYSVGLEEVDLKDNFSIYPNPSSSQLSISTESKITSVTIIDAFGSATNAKLSTANTINVEALPTGVYILQVSTENGLYNKKFIKD